MIVLAPVQQQFRLDGERNARFTGSYRTGSG
jgi:hypothetical protein